jgi:hypothetical protein
MLAGAGVVTGCIGAVVAGRWMQSLLFGTAASDPIVLSSAALVMLVVAAGATWLPARAASKVEPRDLCARSSDRRTASARQERGQSRRVTLGRVG